MERHDETDCSCEPTEGTPRLGRRRLLELGAGATTLATLSSVMPLAPLFADAPRPKRYVSVYFSGGWDVLMGPDPRLPGTYGGLDVGTELLAPQYQNPVAVNVGPTSTYLAAPFASLAGHTDVLTLFRGVNFNTVSHAAGQAYGITGIAPAGNTARGSSLATAMSTLPPMPTSSPIIPNVAIGIPSYNSGYGPSASAMRLATASQILHMLSAPGQQFSAGVEALLDAARNDITTCVSPRFDGPQLDAEQRLSRQRLARIAREQLASRFDATAGSRLSTLYGLNGANDADSNYRAAVAGELIASGIAQSVSLTVVEGLDTHTLWGSQQPMLMERGATALSRLLTHLRESDPMLTDTQVVVFSEFSRTPRINTTQGRDHHFTNSVMVFGGLRPGVFGATGEHDLGVINLDLRTGAANTSGEQLRPDHIAATLAHAVGLPTSQFRNGHVLEELLP